VFFAGGETVTVIRPATRDRTGDRTGADSTFTIDGCAINYQSTTENNDRRETVLSWIELFCPPGADVRPSDKVTLPNGRTYLVDGDPAPWKSPFTSWEPGVVVRLRGVHDAQ
jgi:hypothetical protein